MPKLPAGSAELRQMLKAAAWRLARFLRQPPAKILASPDPIELVESADTLRQERGSGYGQARRLAAKIVRLKASTGKRA